jgi:hypothetical protein
VKPSAPPAPASAPAPPAPKGSPAPAPAAKKLAEGVEAKNDKNGHPYYIKKGVGRIPASQAFK